MKNLAEQLDSEVSNAHRCFRDASEKIMNGEWNDHIVHEQAYWRTRHKFLTGMVGTRESVQAAVDSLVTQLTTGQIRPDGTPTQVFMDNMSLRVMVDVLSCLKKILDRTQ